MKYFNGEIFLKNIANICSDVSFSKEQMEKLDEYARLLVEKNEVMNLTAITDPEGIAVKHFADCFTLAPYIVKTNPKTLADIGTGAGFPGIPLKILFPEIKFYLADSLEKRIKFLREVADSLELSNVDFAHGRAEDLARQANCRESFDLVTARAVAPMRVLLEYCLPFVKIGGSFAAMKAGAEDDDWQKALKILGGRTKTEEVFTLDDGKEKLSRRIYIFEKVAGTPKNYPRKAGTPSKRPL